MAKKTNKAPTINTTLTIPAFVIDTKTLRKMAGQDRDRIEEHFDDQNAHLSKMPTIDAMLQNEKYLAYLTKRIQGRLVDGITDQFENTDILDKDIASLFKSEFKAAQAETKRIKGEKLDAFKKQDPALLETLQISKHDAGMVLRYMERNDIQFTVNGGAK